MIYYIRTMKFFLFLILSTLLFGADFRLKDRLEKAKPGDYIVTESNHMVTLLSVRSHTSSSLILEEISAPLQNLKKRPSSWPEWVKCKAPGHTSWSMLEMDLENGQILECYSFTRSAWIHLSAKESLIATLSHLPMKKIAPNDRRRIGPPPLTGETDIRKIWNPPLIVEGEKIEDATFDAYQTSWPEDGSELSGKTVALYFDKEKKFPFPFWVHVETSHLTGALRTIDSGKNLTSPYPNLPRRIPEFIGSPKKIETGLRLSIKSPKYYKNFELFAIDLTTKEKQITPLHYTLEKQEEEHLSLDIDQEELMQTLKTDHRYTFLLVPIGYSQSYTESPKSILWTN